MIWSLEPQLVYLIAEHHPPSNLYHETSQTTFDPLDQSQHLLHTMHKTFFFSLHFSCIGTFVEIIKHNMLKILLFLPSLILKLLLKIYQFWSAFFFFSNVYWQLLQCNLTKLFWIKLKTTNPEQSHLMEKKQMNILANPVILFWLNN